MISIIIPVYNADRYLEACLASALCQSVTDIEVIAIDDGSTDESPAILEKAARTDARLTVLQQANAGPSVARNRGLELARGEHILFLDADDLLLEGGLEALIADQERSGADLTIGQFQKFDLNGNEIGGFVPCEPGPANTYDRVNLAIAYLREPNRHLTFAYSWGRLFKTDVMRRAGVRFDESMRSYEDVKFNFDYLQHCTNVYLSDALTYRFLVRTDYSSLTFEIGNDPSTLLGYNQALGRIADYVRENAPEVDFEADLATAVVSLSVIQSIRICVNLNRDNFCLIYETMKQLVNEALLQQSFACYEAKPGHSRLIPFLMEHRLVLPLMLACARRGRQRYGKKDTA